LQSTWLTKGAQQLTDPRAPTAGAATGFKSAAGPIETTLRSAIANADQKADQLNVAIDVDRLVVSTATVDLGPTKYRRRVRPAPMGRAYRERRWQNHITIEVESEKE
jgi:large subunit ribosomal protein L22